MLSRNALREEFLARAQDATRPLVANGGFTSYGWAVFLMGRWGNSSDPWVTVYHGDNTIRIRKTYRKEALARPYYHDGRRITHREVETGNLVVELVEGRVHGYGVGARVLAALRLGAYLAPAQFVSRVENFLKRVEDL